MKFQDLNVLDVGNTLQMVGAIYQDRDKAILCYFPGEFADVQLSTLKMSLDEWQIFLRQADHLEVEAMVQDPSGVVGRAILRKSQRQIEQGVAWRVYRRDGYACRYCGADDVALTVDHLVLWELGGPSTEDNLVSACRQCNRTRGNKSYVDWLSDTYYQRVSANLSSAQRQANEEILSRLSKIKIRLHKRSR